MGRAAGSPTAPPLVMRVAWRRDLRLLHGASTDSITSPRQHVTALIRVGHSRRRCPRPRERNGRVTPWACPKHTRTRGLQPAAGCLPDPDDGPWRGGLALPDDAGWPSAGLRCPDGPLHSPNLAARLRHGS